MDVNEETTTETTEQKPPPRRRKRKPVGDAVRSRIQERARKAEKTIRELVRLKRPDLDVEGMTFLEVVDRDADAWGRFVAQVAEWVAPFGQLVDLVFGAPLLALVGLAPSIRAARRDLATRKERKAAEREAAQAEQAQQMPEYGGDGDLIVPPTWQPSE